MPIDPREYMSQYQGDYGDGYPLPRANQRTTNLGGTILKTAAIFIASPFVGKAVDSMIGVAGKGIMRGLSKVATRRPNSVLSRALDASGSSLGKLLSNTSLIKSVSSRYNNYMKSAGIDLTEFSKWKAKDVGMRGGYQSSQRMARVRSFFGDRTTNYTAYRSRLWGGVDSFMRDYAKQVPSMVISDKIINTLTGKRDMERSTAWYNLPGHLINFTGDMAKASIAYLPFYAGFKGAIGAASLVKDATERSIRYNVLRARRAGKAADGSAYNSSSTYANDQLWKVAQGIERGMGKITSVTDRISNAYKEYHTNFRGIRDDSGRKSFVGAVLAGARAMARGYAKPIDRDRIKFTYTGDQMRGNINKVFDTGMAGAPTPPMGLIHSLSRLRGTGIKLDETMSEAITSLYSNYGKPKVGFFGRAFALRPAKYNQSHLDGLINRITGVVSDNVDNSKDMAMFEAARSKAGISNPHLGAGTFDLGKGRVLDLSMFKPKRLISSAVEKANDVLAFNIPFTHRKFHPLEMIGLRSLTAAKFGKKPDLYTFHEGHTIGLASLGEESLASINRLFPSDKYKQAGSTLKLGQDDRAIWVRSSDNGFGNLYLQSGTADSTLTAKIRERYRLRYESPSGRNRKIYDQIWASRADNDLLVRYKSGDNKNKYPETYEEEIEAHSRATGSPRWFSWFRTKVLMNPTKAQYDSYLAQYGKKPWKGLEIGAGYGGDSILTKTTNFFTKFSRDDSPLVYLSSEKSHVAKSDMDGTIGSLNYVRPDNLNPLVNELHQIRGSLYDSLDEAWYLLKRNDISKKFGSIVLDDGSDTTLGDLFGNTMDSRTKLVNEVRRIKGEREYSTHHLSRSMEKVNFALETLESHPEYMKHTATLSPMGRELDMVDELRKFTFKHQIMRRTKTGSDENFLENLLSGGNDDVFAGLSGGERTLVKAIDTLAHFENMTALGAMSDPKRIPANTDLAEYLLKEKTSVDKTNELVGMLMTRYRDGTMDDLSKILMRPTSIKMQNKRSNLEYAGTNSPYMLDQEAPLLPFRQYWKKYYTPALEGATWDKQIGAYAEALGKTMRHSFFPKYAEALDDGTMNYVGDAIPSPTKMLTGVAMRLNSMGGLFGLGLNTSRRTTWDQIGKGIMTNIYLPALGLYAGYRALDTFTDTNPIFASTSLDEGISVALAEEYVKADLRARRVQDLMGITESAKYLEGLFPGMVNSPLARMSTAFAPTMVGATVGMHFGPTGGLAGAGIGAATSLLLGMGLRDYTKSREEMEDIYSGRELVPRRRGRWWEASRQNYAGGRIEAFYPSWFARLKSQYKYTPSLYGSKFEEFVFRNPLMKPIASAIDPYHWERKSYFSAPTPQTGPAFADVPFVGPILGSTAGRIVKPIKWMHKDELEGSINTSPYLGSSEGVGPAYFPPPGIGAKADAPFQRSAIGGTYGFELRHPAPMSQHSLRHTLSNTMYKAWVEPAGMRGFLTQTFMGGIPYQSDTIIEDSNYRTSLTREYWDMQLGGMMGASELFRRFYPRRPASYEIWNPLHNNMATWVPGGPTSKYFIDYQTGSAQTKIPNCLHPDTEVLMYSGELKRADDITIGDVLVSSNGTPVTVLCRRDRFVDKVVSLTLFGDNHHTSIFSDDHPIYTDKHTFTNAIDLKYMDYVAFPRRKYTDECEYIDISTLLTNMDKYSITDNYIYYSRSSAVSHLIEIAEEYDFNYKQIPAQYKRDTEESKRIFSVCRYRDKNTSEFTRIPRYWHSEDIYYLLGVYASEGSLSGKYTFKLTGHNNDKWYDKIIEIMERYNIKYHIKIAKDKDCIDVCSSCTPLIDILSNKAPGKARTKYISSDIINSFNNRNGIINLIRGISDGDGHYCRCATGEVKYGITTTSSVLSYQIRRLFIDIFGIPITVVRGNTVWGDIYKLEAQGYNSTFIAKELGYGIIEWNPKRKTVSNSYYDDEFVYIKIKRVDIIEGYNRVVGYTVSGDNTFCTSLMLTHNSELRLPGWGNMAAYHVSLTMPMRASALGKPIDETVQYLTGTRPPSTVIEEDIMEEGTEIHKIVQEELERANLLVKAEAKVYDPYSDISGHVDAIVRSGRKQMAMEIKSTSTEKLSTLTAPVSYHRSQLNFYLKMLRLREGMITYISREDPNITKTFPVTYDHSLYLRDMAMVQEARAKASELFSMGLGNPGEAYSQLDRLRVLSDIAPYASEYKETLSRVNSLDRLGLLSPEQHDEKMKIMKRRNSMVRTYDFYPRRFDIKGIVSPDPEYQLLSENENIKAAAEYPLPMRIGGGIWEYLTHQRTPIHTKLIGHYSPREQYERYVVYGKESAFWDAPYRDFIEPYMRSTLSTDRPDEGILRGMMGGFLLGGPAGAFLGAGALGVYGTVGMAHKYLTGRTYVPGIVRDRWEMYDYFDKLEYLKASRLYEMTGMEDYAKEMGQTMTGISPMRQGIGSLTSVARAVPNEIKPYIFPFMNETDPGERARIAEIVPDNVANLLRVKWNLMDKDRGSALEIARSMDDSNDLTTYYKDHHLPEEGWCVVENQPIILEDRIDTIKNVNVGDGVINRGGCSVVKEVHKRYIDEDVISIRVFGDRIHTLDITRNHSIFVMKTSRCWKEHGIRLNGICTIAKSSYGCSNCSNILHKEYKVEECNASNISVGDYILIPKIKFAESANTYEGISEEDIWWLIGLFAAEGSYCKYKYKDGKILPTGLVFTLNINEEDIADRICNICRPIGLTCSKYWSIKDSGSSLKVVVFGNDFSRYVKSIIGEYCSSKKLHIPLNSLSYKAAYSFCVGLFNGDGSKTEHMRTRLSTNSYELAVQTRLLLISLGVGATILSKDRAKYNRGIQYVVNVSSANDANFINDAIISDNNIYKKACTKYIFTEDYVMSEVLDISNYRYSGYVYDLSVTNHHEYFPMVALVHNSGWNPNIPLEDVMLKTVENEGMSAHDYGMGFYSQQRRVKYSPHTPGPIDISDPTGISPYPTDALDAASIRGVITSIMSQFGIKQPMVNINVLQGTGSRITVNINMNQEEEVRRHLGLDAVGR